MTLLELKNELRTLRAEVIALRDRVGALEANKKPEIPEEVRQFVAEAHQPAKKLCPKCGLVPAKYFHVRSCKGGP